MSNHETPGWTHTVFRTKEGVFYAVSERVMFLGYAPKEPVRVATPEERFNFYQTLIGEKLPDISTLSKEEILGRFQDKGLDDQVLRQFFGISPEMPGDNEKLKEFKKSRFPASRVEEEETLSPIQKRRLTRAQKKLDKLEAEYQAKLREEEEKNKIFDTLSDEQLSLVEVLEDQGLSTVQIRNILETRAEKIKERDEMVKYLSQPKE